MLDHLEQLTRRCRTRARPPTTSWRASPSARELRVERLVREHAPVDARVRLHELQDGRRFLLELNAYLLRYGSRAR
jgi:hypothetical protein